MSDFGKKVRQRRKKDGMNQKELAAKAGISRTYLSEIERGEAQNISFRVVEKLEEVLGLGEASTGELPPGLQEFADEEDLPPGDIKALGLRGASREASRDEAGVADSVQSDPLVP